jgi:regulator of protease activity HflC (stomatin/prohibitin superfamily)
MERNIQRNGLINLLVLVVVGLGTLAVARYTYLLAGQVVAVFLGLGVLVAAVSWFQMRLEERERLERLEFDELARSRGSEALFASSEAETFPARRAREQFEKFFVPGFSLLLMVLEGLGAVWLWRWLDRVPAAPLRQPLMAMGLLGLFALVLFLIGKYSAGLARLENQRLLQPGASQLLLGAYLNGVLVAELVAFEAGFKFDRQLARGLCVLLGLLAAEMLVTLVLEVYRPRVKGRVEHLLYDSRLIGLVSHPEGLLATAAHVLDYQFGFKVSETWFYRFLEKALAWLVLAQLGLLWLSTCFVCVEPGEEALLERFGQPVGQGVLGPGPHLKLPWPIDKVYRYPTDRVQVFTVGHGHEAEAHRHERDSGVILWTVAHTKEEFLLPVANRQPAGVPVEPTEPELDRRAGQRSPPVSLLAANIPVRYQITNLTAWAYSHKNPAELLEHLGTREVSRYLVNADLREVTSRGRLAAAETLRQRIQERANQMGLGVRILSVALSDLHPPVKVAGAYEQVVGAQLRRLGRQLEAETHRFRTNALARAAATNIIRRAQAESQRAQVSAWARVDLFTNQMVAYRAAPEVYLQRAYLQTLTRGAAGARKYVLATTNARQIIQFNLEDKLRPDLGDFALPSPTRK